MASSVPVQRILDRKLRKSPDLYASGMNLYSGALRVESVAGSNMHGLVLTDIASGWTEAAALVVHEQTLITVTVGEIRRKLQGTCPARGPDE